MPPLYISELCDTENIGLRQLTCRSATSSAIGWLIELKLNPSTKFGDRAFRVLGPKAWNKFTPQIKC